MNKTRQVWAAPVRFCARASNKDESKNMHARKGPKIRRSLRLDAGEPQMRVIGSGCWGKAVMDGELDGDLSRWRRGRPQTYVRGDSGCAIPRALICSTTISTFNVASGPPGQSARAELVCAGAGDRIIMGEDLEAREAEKHTQPTTPYLVAANHRTRTHLGSILRDIAP